MQRASHSRSSGSRPLTLPRDLRGASPGPTAGRKSLTAQRRSPSPPFGGGGTTTLPEFSAACALSPGGAGGRYVADARTPSLAEAGAPDGSGRDAAMESRTSWELSRGAGQLSGWGKTPSAAKAEGGPEAAERERLFELAAAAAYDTGASGGSTAVRGEFLAPAAARPSGGSRSRSIYGKAMSLLGGGRSAARNNKLPTAQGGRGGLASASRSTAAKYNRYKMAEPDTPALPDAGFGRFDPRSFGTGAKPLPKAAKAARAQGGGRKGGRFPAAFVGRYGKQSPARGTAKSGSGGGFDGLR